jgi:hypothetical protein
MPSGLPRPEALIKRFHASHYMNGLHEVVRCDEQALNINLKRIIKNLIRPGRELISQTIRATNFASGCRVKVHTDRTRFGNATRIFSF